MYVSGLIPRNFGELAEAVPIEAREEVQVQVEHHSFSPTA